MAFQGGYDRQPRRCTRRFVRIAKRVRGSFQAQRSPADLLQRVLLKAKRQRPLKPGIKSFKNKINKGGASNFLKIEPSPFIFLFGAKESIKYNTSLNSDHWLRYKIGV